MTATGIILKNTSLQYHNEKLFDDLNCEFPGGEFSCLLGPSGVGKSTLLRIIANLNSYDIHVKQKATINITNSHHIAYMAQNDLLLPWLDVLHNVLLGDRLRSQKITDKLLNRAYQLLNAVGLAQDLNKFPDQLSGGMRQRVALARTLMENRPIVLMDEPFSALDPITRLQLQDLAAQLLKGHTVLLVTHDPLEALRLGHHIFIMSGKPAILEELPKLPENPPRDITNPQVLELQGMLLKKLEAAQGSYA